MFTNQLSPTTTDNHYQFKTARNANTPSVRRCQAHRYKTNQATFPSLSVGYTGSALGTTDNNNSQTNPFYQLQRPASPSDPYGRRIDTQGEYYPTNTASDLNPIFTSIAKSILLKLTS